MQRLGGFGEGKKRGRSSGVPQMLFVPEPTSSDSDVIKACLAVRQIDFPNIIDKMQLDDIKALHATILENKPSGNVQWFIRPYLGFVPEIRAIQDSKT